MLTDFDSVSRDRRRIGKRYRVRVDHGGRSRMARFTYHRELPEAESMAHRMAEVCGDSILEVWTPFCGWEYEAIYNRRPDGYQRGA
jgi:hypothetical protein